MMMIQDRDCRHWAKFQAKRYRFVTVISW